MNQEPKTTIEELMEECFTLKHLFGGCNYLHLTMRYNGIYQANAYGMDIIEDASAITALAKLKVAIEGRAKKEATTELERAERELATAQAKVVELAAIHQRLNLTPNQ